MHSLRTFLAAGALAALAFACSSDPADDGTVAPPPGFGEPAPGAAGNTVGAGGSDATGGTAAGGDVAAAGGTPPAAAGGAAGGETAAGGTDAAGGETAMTPMGPNAVLPSSGCGVDPVAGLPADNGYTQFAVGLTGATPAGNRQAHQRNYYVRLPTGYDPNRAYRIVYLGYGCGDRDAGDSATYRLYDTGAGGNDTDAIYVGISMPPAGNPGQFNGDGTPCYDDDVLVESSELETLDLIHQAVRAGFCVDENRIYYGGYSSAAWVANMMGCYFAEPAAEPRMYGVDWKLRGQFSVTGGEVDLTGFSCNGPVASIWIHDANDTANVYSGSTTARDRVLTVNGCTGSATEPWGTDLQLGDRTCEKYTDCPAEYPVVLCTSQTQGHGDQQSFAIPAFTKFFEEMNPTP